MLGGLSHQSNILCAADVITRWPATDRVAHASRVLAKASGVRELFSGSRGSFTQRQFTKRSFRRDAETSTRDACATPAQNDSKKR